MRAKLRQTGGGRSLSTAASSLKNSSSPSLQGFTKANKPAPRLKQELTYIRELTPIRTRQVPRFRYRQPERQQLFFSTDRNNPVEIYPDSDIDGFPVHGDIKQLKRATNRYSCRVWPMVDIRTCIFSRDARFARESAMYLFPGAPTAITTSGSESSGMRRK